MAVKARGRMEITDCTYSSFEVENRITHTQTQCQQNTGALGCGYSGKTVDVRRHERERCRRRMIVCPHEGCEVWVPFEDIPAHSMICQAVRSVQDFDYSNHSLHITRKSTLEHRYPRNEIETWTNEVGHAIFKHIQILSITGNKRCVYERQESVVTWVMKRWTYCVVRWTAFV